MTLLNDLGKVFNWLKKRKIKSKGKDHKVRRWFWGQMRR